MEVQVLSFALTDGGFTAVRASDSQHCELFPPSTPLGGVCRQRALSALSRPEGVAHVRDAEGWDGLRRAA